MSSRYGASLDPNLDSNGYIVKIADVTFIAPTPLFSGQSCSNLAPWSTTPWQLLS